MKDLLPKLGTRLKEIRKTRGLTQEALAEKIDLSPQYLSRLEGGHQSPSLETVARLAEALDLELWELFDLRHQGTVKEMRERLRRLIQESNEQELRLALKLLHALFR
ncbi:MAG: helix-turn-helix transcriptional regulator [Pseudomonadota bacterium]|jgi:transcriptional regulator with XRE-family HTH domain